jgi:hypothetical protein
MGDVMSDDEETDQEYVPRDADESSASAQTKTGKEVAVGSQGSWSRLVDVMQGTTYALRKQKQKVDAQTDLIRSYRQAEEELHALMETGKRMKRQEALIEAEYADKLVERQIKALQRNLDIQRLEREAVEEKNRVDRLALEHEMQKASLELQIEQIKKDRLALQGQASEPQKEVVDPHVEQARTALKQCMDRHQNLRADKRKWFTLIDEDLANGTISEEEAEEMKEDLDQVMRDNTLSP